MAKLNFVQLQSKSQGKGVIVGSLFPVKKVNGYSLKFKSKIRNEKNELVDMTGKKLMEIAFGDGFLCIENTRKREGRRDPSHIVLAYPNAKAYVPKK